MNPAAGSRPLDREPQKARGPLAADQLMRASDDDRGRVVSQLEAHTAAGRLDLDEFAERVDRALSARTHSELAEVTRDLPALAEPGGESLGGGRHLLIAFLIAALTIAVLAIAFAAAHR